MKRNPGKGLCDACYVRLRCYQDPEYKQKIRAKASQPKERFRIAQYSAKKRGREWTISFSEFEELLLKPCTYCGGKTGTTGSGLDRKDNSRGYTVDNVYPCCKECNRLRGDRLTPQETAAVVITIMYLREGTVWTPKP